MFAEIPQTWIAFDNIKAFKICSRIFERLPSMSSALREYSSMFDLEKVLYRFRLVDCLLRSNVATAALSPFPMHVDTGRR